MYRLEADKTKGSLGVPRVAWLGRLGRVSPTGMNEYAFYDTTLDNCIDNAFQALALDERRGAFIPSVWEKRGNTETVCGVVPCMYHSTNSLNRNSFRFGSLEFTQMLVARMQIKN